MIVLFLVALMAFAYGFYTSMLHCAVPFDEESSGVPLPGTNLKAIMGGTGNEAQKAA